MSRNNMSSLELLRGLAQKIDQQMIGSSYWKKEEEMLAKRIERRKKEALSITMSSEKLHKAFSL